MQNPWRRLSDLALSAAATQAHTVINGNILGYGVTPAQMTLLNTNKNALAAASTDLIAKKDAYEAALLTRDNSRVATIGSLANIGGTIYNNSTVTNVMLAAAGYAVYDSSGTTIIPVTPIDLLANPDAEGSVKLSWKRNGNPQGVVFVIEQSPDGEAWSQVFSTTKARVTLSGFTPGVEFWFRVRATKNDIVTLPSVPAGIWAPGGQQFQLQVA